MARLAAEAKRIENIIKQNNRLVKAAAANVNNAENLNQVFKYNKTAANVNNAAKLNKIFKNNKTILARLRRLWGRLRR